VSRGARAFHRHAQALLDHELHRARGRLTEIPVERRLVVEEVSARVAAAVVDAVLLHAHDEPSLAQALASIYDGEPVPELRAVSCVAD
jgi:hypothetical protein